MASDGVKGPAALRVRRLSQAFDSFSSCIGRDLAVPNEAQYFGPREVPDAMSHRVLRTE